MTTPLSCIPHRVPAYRLHQTCLVHMVPTNPSTLAPQASVTVPATAESARAVTAGHGRPEKDRSTARDGMGGLGVPKERLSGEGK